MIPEQKGELFCVAKYVIENKSIISKQKVMHILETLVENGI